jgi:hypothetical protein
MVMTIVWTLLLFLLFLVLLIICVPFYCRIRGSYDHVFYGDARVTWLWGLFGMTVFFKEQSIQLTFGRFTLLKTAIPKKSKKHIHTKHVSEKKQSRPQKNPLRLVRVIPEIILIIKRIMRSLRFRGSINATIGIGDPAETGVLYGLLTAILPWIALPLHITPDFQNELFIGNGEICFRLWIANIIIIGIRILLSSQGRKLFRAI